MNQKGPIITKNVQLFYVPFGGSLYTHLGFVHHGVLSLSLGHNVGPLLAELLQPVNIHPYINYSINVPVVITM
jgi:hypothetical protein